MAWTPKDIYRLRKSLNWTKDQLSRRLSCSMEYIIQLEAGTEEANQEVLAQLNQLKNQSDLIFEQRKNQPHAEKIMQDYGLVQIDKELIDELVEKE